MALVSVLPVVESLAVVDCTPVVEDIPASVGEPVSVIGVVETSGNSKLLVTLFIVGEVRMTVDDESVPESVLSVTDSVEMLGELTVSDGSTLPIAVLVVSSLDAVLLLLLAVPSPSLVVSSGRPVVEMSFAVLVVSEELVLRVSAPDSAVEDIFSVVVVGSETVASVEDASGCVDMDVGELEVEILLISEEIAAVSLGCVAEPRAALLESSSRLVRTSFDVVVSEIIGTVPGSSEDSPGVTEGPLLPAEPEADNLEPVIDSILVSPKVESELGVMMPEVLDAVINGVVLTEPELDWIGPDESSVTVIEVVE
ncbi:uncharacterized protein PG998_009857 [Apiospora kogelbergensis]|uniref:Uncharacterized protein n=1 Tax=Apiospora kogelbergensis TaxID=1337665 RepID=A0AAW0R8U7_9PEZI